MSKMLEKARVWRAKVAVAALLLPVLVMAQGNDATDAFTEKAGEVGAAVAIFGLGLVTLAAVGVGFGVAMKYVKKLKGAA